MSTRQQYKISIIIVGYNSLNYLVKLIPTIQTRFDHEIILIDNASTDETTVIMPALFPQVKIISNAVNEGYARAVNRGVSESSGEYIIVSNADVEFYPDSIETLIDYLDGNEHAALVGPQQIFPDGSWQRSFGVVPGLSEAMNHLAGMTSLQHLMRRELWGISPFDKRAKSVGYIDGAVLTFRRSVYDEVNGFDEDFFFYGEEADFALRLRKAGWEVVFLPAAKIVHVRGGSSTKAESINEKYLQLQVNGKLLVVKKHNPPWKVKAYCYLQKLYSLKMFMLYTLLNALLSRKGKTCSGKAMIFKLTMQMWSDKLQR